ncbi:MAG: FtsX-like permease family protein, partial [Candidatus Thorarchaeota archaeon]
MASTKPDTLKGNPWWALAYALTSLRNYPVRNMGIALILSIGVALPTTVFIWSTTGTDIVVEDFFHTEPIQMTMVPRTDESAVSSDLAAATSFVERNRYVEDVHTVPTTVGVLVGDFHPYWSSYNLYGLNYLYGIKDGRVLLVTNDFLSNISYWLNFKGNATLSAGEILVSSDFVDRTFDVYGITIEVGSTIDLDMLKRASSISGTPEDFDSHPLRNMTVTGIYKTTSKSGLMLQAFPSISRKNWDPFGYTDTVLGIRDSVMILQEEISEDDLETVYNSGFFDPVAFIQPSKDNLMKSGASNIATNLVNLRTQIDEQYPLVYVDGLIELWRLNAFINTYLSSQVLTVVALPILVMSLMLTVFTSETSVARRKSEISALRAKGASFNQVFTTFMWESIFLSIIGLLIGIILAVFMAPLIASSTGLFTFDLTVYLQFLSMTQFTILSIIIAIAIAMYLP